MGTETTDPRIFTKSLYGKLRVIGYFADDIIGIIEAWNTQNGYGIYYWGDDPSENVASDDIYSQMEDVYNIATNFANIIQYITEEGYNKR